ncbi:MAG: PorV/PorQ family protein [Dysgonamonadaceae bacterium]|jgi:hypothetical protein|nr:PorV/PorQ family protein [Dysgonamonadaceae bacterium]
MRKIIIILFTIPVCISVTRGQDILSIVPDARSSGMGNIGLSQSSNAFSLYGYAGVMALDSSKGAAGYSFTGWMPSYNMHSLHAVAGYWKFSKRQNISAGVRYFSYPKVITTDNDGSIIGTFTPFDMVVDLGYGYAINSHLTVAAIARYVTGKISDAEGTKAASAFGADFGIYFCKNRISAGLAVSNIGTKINYGGAGSSMPARAKVAGGYSLPIGNRQVINSVAEAAYAFLPENYTGFEAGVGAEYVYDKRIAVRAGYRLGNSENNPVVVPNNFGSSLSYATLGIGVNIWRCSVDASYIFAGSESPIRNSFRMSLSLKF